MQADASEIGQQQKCAGCREVLTVPAQSSDVAPMQIAFTQISAKMLAWTCPQCGNVNRIRTSTLGSQTQCKECRLTLSLPQNIPTVGAESLGCGCVLLPLIVTVTLLSVLAVL